ncbi:hypothetical protein D3C75_1368130 [compost metagenome]
MFAGHSAGDDADIRHALGNGLDDTQAWQFVDVDVDGRVVFEKTGEQFRQVFGQCCGVAQ